MGGSPAACHMDSPKECARRKRMLLTVDGCHDESDLCRVGGTCEVGVDLLGLVLVQGHEAVEDVVARGGVVGTTWEPRIRVSNTANEDAVARAKSSPS